MKEWYEDDLLNKKYKKYFGEVPPIFKNMRLDWKRTYFIDAGLEKNEDTNVDNEDDPENDFGLDEDMRYKYDTDEDNDDRYPRYKKGGVISEQKFDISDNEASEDAYEWIMDNINEDIEIDEETDEQLRESEIDEVVRYFNGELENHRIETKESKNSMTLYVIKKMAKGGKTSVSPLKDGGEVEKPFKVKIIYYGAIEYNEELNLFAKNKEDAFEKASDSDEVKNKGYKIISVDEVKLLEFKKAKTKEDVKKILDELQIEKYIINDDLSVDVKGSVNIKNKNLIKIPVKFNKVSGTFDCENNFLTSLHGCPEKVGGWFLCKNNKLTNLHGGPKFVDIDYISSNNQLTSLEGSPEKVKGRFDCSNNQLTSLKGSPQFVGRDFDCSNNKLTSLEYAPKIIKGSIISYKNNIVDSPKKDTNDKKRVDDAIKKLGQNPSNYEVANFVYNNYNKVTGEKKSMRDEEMDFPTQIYDIIEHYKLDVDEFTQNYSKAAEGYEKGGKTSVSPLKDRIIGSKKNKIGTASSKTSAKDIELNDSIIEALSEKAKEYNEKHSNKVSTSTLKAVMRRGMGAFSSSHRPGMTRQGWGYARVNKFLLKKGGTKVKATYTQDDDLLENGGELKKIVRVSDKPKFKKLMELEDKAKDSMYRKSNRNNFQRWNETTGQNFANRWNKMVLELRGYNDTEGKGKGSAKAEWIEYCKEQGMVEDYNFGDVIA